MSQNVVQANGQIAAPISPGGWLRRTLPSTLVFALLIGLGLWGHSTDWAFGVVNHGLQFGTRDAAANLTTIRFDEATPRPIESRFPMGAALVFATDYDVERAGIDIAPVWTAPMTEALQASGELAFDPGLVARLSPRLPGTVWSVLKKIGAKVQPGEVVALVDAVEVGKAKSELQQSMTQVRLRRKALTDLHGAGNAVNQRQRQESEAALKDAEVRLLAAEQALLNLGLPVRAIELIDLPRAEAAQRLRGLGVPGEAGFDSATGTANLLPVRAPFAGWVIDVNVVAGEVVGNGTTLMTIADPRQLWLTLHVRQEAAHRVAIQQTVKFRPDGAAEEATARVNWIGTTANETTRTVPIRSVLANTDGRLRASTLGQGRVILRETPNAIIVPRGAVQTFRGSPIVFVRHPDFLKADGPKEFQARTVVVGTSDDNHTEVLSGLVVNEVVASKGAPILLAELNRLVSAQQTQKTMGK